MLSIRSICLGLVLFGSCSASELAFFGTYTGKGSDGIYAATFDPATGKLGTPSLMAKTSNPSFLALHPNGKFLYAVNEGKEGRVTAYTIGANGKLTELNSASTRAADPCHIAVSPSGRVLAVANYGTGLANQFAIGPDGKIGAALPDLTDHGTGPDKGRQEGPHAHSVNFSRDGRLLLWADLGTDRVLAATEGKAGYVPGVVNSMRPGAGPRHLVYSPDGRFVYSINEMASTITVSSLDRNGKLTEVQTISTLPTDFHGENSTAEVAIDPTGKWVYGSNRGHDSIARFRVDRASGKLTLLGWTKSGGKTPRSFAIEPGGKWLLTAHQDSGDVFVFALDPATGDLKPAGPKTSVPQVVDILFYSPR